MEVIKKVSNLITCRVGKGGGIYNAGKLTLSSTVLYNNHARLAGDDLYGEETGSVYLSTVGNNWILDDCNHKIDVGIKIRYNTDGMENI